MSEYAQLEGDTRSGIVANRTTKLIATNPCYKSLRQYPLLTELDVSDNTSITDLNYLHNLVKLAARGRSGLTSKGLAKLRLTDLDISDNPNIDKLDQPKLVRLVARGSRCRLSQVDHLVALTQLIIDHNQLITQVRLPNLTKLSARYTKLTQSGLSGLHNLTYLDLTGCQQISDLNHLHNLTWLSIAETEIPVQAIISLPLTYLDISDNTAIDDLSMMVTVHRLRADGDCLASGRLPPNLTHLSAEDNKYLIDIELQSLDDN